MKLARRLSTFFLSAGIAASMIPASTLMASAEGLSVQEQINSVKNGENITITLDDQYSGNLTIPEGVNVILDLNGQVIYAGNENNGDAISNYGHLTIQDSKGTGSIQATTGSAVTNYVSGNVTINGGLYNSEDWYTLKNMGKMTIEDGTFTQKADNISSLIDNGWYGSDANDRGVKESDQMMAMLYIKGGSLTGSNDKATVKSDDYSITKVIGGRIISDHAFAFQASGKVWITEDSTVEVSAARAVASIYGFDNIADPGIFQVEGGTFTAPAIITEMSDNGTVDIYNGNFIRLTSIVEGGDPKESGVTKEIFGGTFTADPSAYVYKGYEYGVPSKAVDNGDGTFSIVPEDQDQPDTPDEPETPEQPSQPEKPQEQPAQPVKEAEKVSTIPMYRLYNPNSGEHFYTASEGERDYLDEIGWNYEGIGWNAPAEGSPVYRLYNPNAGDHHYTLSTVERDSLVALGWNYEGIGWYSADESGIPVYRQYNPNAKAGAHNFTTSKQENDYLDEIGWNAEGIAWYAAK